MSSFVQKEVVEKGEGGEDEDDVEKDDKVHPTCPICFENIDGLKYDGDHLVRMERKEDERQPAAVSKDGKEMKHSEMPFPRNGLFHTYLYECLRWWIVRGGSCPMTRGVLISEPDNVVRFHGAFDNARLKEAANLWFENWEDAEERYGPIGDWDTIEVTDMSQ
eukprot:CAMPEP_0118633234 /NCGR_PEP_ID=MMETSP0785-20121206/884_1 /TAXON_ID=91992 /ORGANISM="Bolidomonas pacifica, Strain CCMP 1866" /LENGTH=162 /DNA_ID=CAMNT_0006524087 /DNA_START=655 /DNA_END=1143 /DNA_ORIENTATION=-